MLVLVQLLLAHSFLAAVLEAADFPLLTAVISSLRQTLDNCEMHDRNPPHTIKTAT